jgi:ATP-dependent Lon protease
MVVKKGGIMKNVTLHTTGAKIPEVLPVIPTMDVVVFPHMIVPLLVLDERIILGVERALQDNKLVLLVAAKKQATSYHEAIGTKDLYSIGTVATIMRMIKIPEGGIKVLVQGLCKAVVREIIADDAMLSGLITPCQEPSDDETDIAGHIKAIKDLAERVNSSGQFFSPDFHIILSRMQDPQKIADFVLSHLNLSVEDAQSLLERETTAHFLEGICHYLSRELEAAEMQERIKMRARESMNKSQKEFYLREQLKAIKKELGEDEFEDIEQMRQKLETLHASKEVYTEISRQINRLERTSPDSMEATVIRNYLDWMLALPWNKETEDIIDLEYAKKVLDQDHYGLLDVKDRILDFISIKHLKKDGTSPILCLVGPPGTGKTSLGKSIAKSLGREYARISLGGVKDEAEIRGHRRTYVGAMPGRFIQAFRKVKSCNPVIIIDELDKLGADFRGDPSAAMLEVLDPQQNKAFHDNYLGVPFDLSKVMFIATANRLDTICEPLRDRMEIIQLSGYTFQEKIRISNQYLIKHALQDCGLQEYHLNFSDDIIAELITGYTREAGVRELERMIRKLCSKAARSLVQQSTVPEFHPVSLNTYLGPRKFIEDPAITQPHIGIANGLAWTAYGGEMIKIESVIMPGKGRLMLTGQLGEVMKESAQAALSYVRAHAKEFGIHNRMFTQFDLHIHVPAGGVPKDGPSAGITLLSSILSALTQRPVNAHYAMTGEVNLKGDVMPIGGVKEKILAAKRNKISHIILPERNQHDLAGSEDIVEGIEVIWVKHADEVLKRVLMEQEKKL